MAFATDDLERSIAVQLHVGDGGVLVLSPEDAMGAIREAVAPVDGAPEDGLASGAERRAISRARVQLFSLQQLWTAHRQLLADDGSLVEMLGDAAKRRLRRALRDRLRMVDGTYRFPGGIRPALGPGHRDVDRSALADPGMTSPDLTFSAGAASSS